MSDDLKRILSELERWKDAVFKNDDIGEGDYHQFTKDFSLSYRRGIEEINIGERLPDLGMYKLGNYPISICFSTGHFSPEVYHVYHGTSTDALDKILESGRLRTAADLHRSGELVSGEMKQILDKQGDSISGPKYMHPEIFRRLGIELSEQDMRIFGHAYAVFFGHYLVAQAYTPKDPQKKAMLVLNKNALEDRGYTLIDCKEEGVKCESSISLDFGFQALLVPDTMVEEYKTRIGGKYFTSVFPLSDLGKV